MRTRQARPSRKRRIFAVCENTGGSRLSRPNTPSREGRACRDRTLRRGRVALVATEFFVIGRGMPRGDGASPSCGDFIEIAIPRRDGTGNGCHDGEAPSPRGSADRHATTARRRRHGEAQIAMHDGEAPSPRGSANRHAATARRRRHGEAQIAMHDGEAPSPR